MYHIINRLYENRRRRVIEEALEGSTFVELETFKDSWKSLKLKDEDLVELQNVITSMHPENTISIGGNVYKIRFSPPSMNRGKSSSHRVIYIDLVKDSNIYLVYAYSKSKQSDLTKEQELYIKEIAKKL